jgi:hypothetical protein
LQDNDQNKGDGEFWAIKELIKRENWFFRSFWLKLHKLESQDKNIKGVNIEGLIWVQTDVRLKDKLIFKVNLNKIETND